MSKKTDNSKQCTKCGEVKPLTEFYKDPRVKSGVRSNCKACSYKFYDKNRDRSGYLREYEQRKDRKEYRRKYRKSTQGQQVKSKYNKWYNKTEKSEAAREKHRKSERGKELSRIRSNNRRAIKLQAEGDYTIQEWNELCKRYGYRCVKCKHRRKLTADHIVPLSKGGTNYISNIQPLCLFCNCEKWTKIADYRPDGR